MPGRAPGWFTLTVTLNGVNVGALIDTGCGRTLVKRAKGPFTPEILRKECIHGDIREYHTKVVTVEIGSGAPARLWGLDRLGLSHSRPIITENPTGRAKPGSQVSGRSH